MYWNSRLSTCFLGVCTTCLLGIHHKYVNLLSDLFALHQTNELQALVHSLARFVVPTMPLIFLCIAILALVSALVRTGASSTLSASTSATLSIFRTIPSTSVLFFFVSLSIWVDCSVSRFPILSLCSFERLDVDMLVVHGASSFLRHSRFPVRGRASNPPAN